MLKSFYNKKYMSLALHALATLAVLILIAAFLFRFSEIRAATSLAATVIRPIFIALILAYFCNPVMKLGEKYVFRFLDKVTWLPKQTKRVCSLLLSYLVFILFITAILLLTIPELVQNYESLIKNLTDFVLIAVNWIDSVLHLANIDSIAELIIKNSNRILDAAVSFLPSALVGIGQAILSLILSVVLSFFMLLYKEAWTAGLKRTTLAVLPRRLYAEISDTLLFANRTFGRYLLGSVFDSILVGVECFIAMTIFGVPYSALVSVIVGMTNIIPYFGPFIGSIPAFFIILTQDVFKAFLFLALIIVIQQIDGNIINPRIVGKTTSINSMWVIIAITVVGGWLGIVGMVIAIPLFSVFYMLVRRLINSLLQKKGLTTETAAYASSFSVSQFRAAEGAPPKNKRKSPKKKKNTEGGENE